MKRKFLAALLALVMVFSMIPVSASAADYVESSQNGYFTITYDNRVIDRTLTVNMKDVEGNLLDSLTVTDVQAADAAIQIALTPAYKNEYNIACVEIANGTQTLLNVSNDVCSFRTTISSAATVTVILCKQPNIEGEEIDPGYGTIQYRAYEPALLKLLKSNGVSVDKNTVIEDVEFGFIGEYLDEAYDFSYTPTGANNLAYFHAILSNAGCRATPNNIKSLVITYSQNGNEQSIAIPSEKLRYVSENGIYKIEANDDSISVVAFYYEAGAELTTWSLYDVRFVDTGTALGSENMPADPTYGDGNKYIFTNWDKNVTGGDPFLPYEKVLDDTVVYAQKTSSPERGGTEIHVMNTDNELANRIMEIYNAENDTQLGSNSIDMDSVTIYATSKDGKTTTNHNYWNNGWRPLTGGNQYYRVINSDIAGDHPTISNDHIAHDNIGSITITATVNGTSFTVKLPVDEAAPGAVSVSSVQDNIIEISVNGAPDTPTDDELTGDTGLLKEGAVKVTCTNEEATHLLKEQTYGLLDGYTLSDVQWTGDGETGYYYVDITVPADEYVNVFSIDTKTSHTLAATDTIRLQYANEGWKVIEGETPVTFEVACTTEPGGGDEDAPNDDELKAALSGMIQVDCITNEEQHLVKSYGVIDGGINRPDPDEVTKNGETYTYTVTVDSAKYLGKYSSEYGNHELVSTGTITITLQYDAEKETWYVDTPVTIEVKCDSGTTDPEKPDGDTIIGLLGNEAVLVQCDVADSGHARRYYPLLSGTFTIGDVENNTVKVTVDSNEYLKEYTLYSGKEHSEVIAQDENYFTLTWNGKDWTVSGNPVTFTVHCSTTEEPEEPTAPDVENILGPNAVEVLCVTNNGIHGSKTYGLLNGGYMEQGPDWITGQGEEDGYWQYVVTIDAGVYQAQFNTDTKSKHNLASPAETYLPITLIYRDNTWVIEGTEPYATIELVCDSEEPTLPEKPDDETIYDIFNGNKPVVLACVTENSGHEEQAFDLIPGSYEIGEVKEIGGRYLCDITIVDEQDYIDIYNTETGKEHTLSSANQPIQVLTLKYTDGEWAIDDDGTVYYTVACEDTSTEPTPDPDPTPDPTPTPGPGGGDKPPYIPPVDPDDSGVSDLLNTDDHIQYLFGYPEGTFGPENNMTRAEVAQMFYNLLLDQDVTITKTFDDVPANAWYAKAVNTLASLGVVSGVGNGDFEPERSITRAEFTSIAMKFAEGKTGGTNIFSDVKSTDWFYRAVVNSTQYGWIHGYGDGTFRPNNPITRVEVTAIVNNMLGREADVDFVTEHYDELNHFSDLVVSHWGYYHIVEATNDHDYTKPSSGENWTELN